MDRKLAGREPGTIVAVSSPPSAFADVYAAHAPGLLKVAYLLTDSAAQAEDAVHEVFVRCAHRLDEIEHPPSYLRTAVVNECRTQHRRAVRREQAATLLPGAASADMPHDVLETRRALAVLNERQRTAVVLRYFVDIPDDEIAAVLECAPATVRSLLHRALKLLEEELR